MRNGEGDGEDGEGGDLIIKQKQINKKNKNKKT